MSPKLRDLLVALPARQLNLIVGGAVVIVLLLAWTLALRAPLAAYRQHKTTLATMEASGAAAPTAPSPSPSAPAPAITPAAAPPEPVALIAAVSRSATQSGVAVLSAAQGAQRTVAGVRLLTVEIVASGGYIAVLDWLATIERQQPTVGIQRLTVEAAPDTDDRAITLQLVIYDTGTPP